MAEESDPAPQFDQKGRGRVAGGGRGADGDGGDGGADGEGGGGRNDREDFKRNGR